jgi:hypothetical protein
MAADDLASIPGMQDKHRRVLSERLRITTGQALADADGQSIFDAMRRMKPPPTLEEIRLWQDQARRQRAVAVSDAVDWDQAASFVVVFEYRQREVGLQRRLAVEHTELEPAQPPRIWPDWNCRDICSWMRDRVDLVEKAATDDASGPAGGAGSDAAADHDNAAAHDVSEALRIARITLKDSTREIDMLATGAQASASPLAISGDAQLEVVVAGLDADHETWILARTVGAGRARVVLHGPAVMSAGGSVEIDLSALPVDDNETRVVVWTPDASARSSAVKLTPFTRLAYGPSADTAPSAGVAATKRARREKRRAARNRRRRRHLSPRH